MRKLFILFLTLNINIPTFQANLNNNILKANRIRNSTFAENLSFSKKKYSNLNRFLCIIGVVSFIFLLVFFLAKISAFCGLKKFVHSKLFEKYAKNELINDNNLLFGIKEIYGIKYIFSFLFEKIFISTEFKKAKNKYLDTCTICMDDFNEKDKIYTTSCEHIFHRKCIENYLNLIKREIADERRIIENINSYLRCPNCKSYLLSKSILSKEKNVKNNKKNNSKGKNKSIDECKDVNNANDSNKKENDIISNNIGVNINKEKTKKKIKFLDSNINQNTHLVNVKNKNEIISEKIPSYSQNDTSSRKIIWVIKNKKLNPLRVLRNKYK